jgi:lipopolysaccharide transport system ATP-binding protein
LSKAYRLGQIGTGTLTNDLRVWWAKVRGKPNPLLKIGQKDPSIRPSSAVNRPPSSASVSPSATKDQGPSTKYQGPGTKDETTDVGRPRTKDEGLADHDSDTIWALRDVSFSVKQGEVLGIIGRNGAGKSTVLKILSRITAPTQGEVKVKGRIASLLEVGTGFHPELTGRENTYLNGAILGMTKAEVDRKFDEIVAFSEVEQFIDTPVKRYSSGMYVRLAFAVAAHLDPEILLVDEVLAVGDASFQKKCLGKMGDVARGGRTVLFVSHNMVALQSLCESALWLEQGSVRQRGPSSQVVADYLKHSVGSGSTRRVWEEPATAPGNEVVRLRRVEVSPERDSQSGLVAMDGPFRIEVEYWNRAPGSRLHITLHISNEQGVVVFTTGSGRDPAWRGRPLPVGLYRSTCHVPGNLLNSGAYLSRVIFRHDDAVSFDVADLRERQEGWLGREPGVIRPLLEWTTEHVGEESSVQPGSSVSKVGAR